MINALIDFSLRRRAFILLGVVALAAVGFWSAARLPMDAIPDITNVQVQINTSAPALAPEEIEKLITYPVELGMGGIEGLEEIRSISKFGLSQVTLVFTDATNLYRARQLVSERIQTILDELPPGITPKLAPITTGLGEIYHYVVRYKEGAGAADKEEALRELKLAQDYVIKPVLRTVPGVAEVNTSGGRDKEIVVTPDPDKLATFGISIADIAAAVAENTANAGGGVVEKGGESVTVRAVSRVGTAAEIAALPLKFAGRPAALRISDVAQVKVGSGARVGAATYNGEEAVLGSVLMLVGENSRTVAARVNDALSNLRQKLPPGIEVETVYSRASLVGKTITTVRNNLAEGALLVIAVLIALLGNWRAALIVAATIPLSLLFALTGMEQRGIPGNLMSLGAVDFGLVVDGAVVMAENIVRVLAQRQHELGRLLTKAERRDAIGMACRQVSAPTVFGVIIITIVYLPLFSLGGAEGRTFSPMAFTVVLALTSALLLALTLVPVLASLCLSGKVSEKESPLMRFAKYLYLPLLRVCLRVRWLVCMFALAVFAFALVVFSRLGAEFLPRLDEGDMAVQMIRTTSIGLNTSIELQKKTERSLLEQFPEVSRVFARVGTSEVATDPMGVNVGDSYVLLKPRKEWRRTPDGTRPISKEELTTLMARELETRFPGQSHLFSQPVELRFNELLSGSRADIAIKVFGDDFGVIEKIAGEVREIIEKIPGAEDVEFDAAGRTPVLQIAVNREAILRYNVHASEVNAVVNAAFAGDRGGVIVEGNRRFPVTTRLPETARADFQTVPRLLVRTSDGGVVPLGSVANIEVVESVGTIMREAFQRRMSVQVNLRGRDTQSFVDEARARLAAELKLPEGVFIEFGGSFKNLAEARGRLAIVVPTALALIFVLVFLATGSVRQTLIIYTGIPLAVTGGVFSLWVRDMPFSISAGVGFIALSGVAILNGLMMISFINQLRASGTTVRDAVIEGALTRLRPVLMTALVASL
ncbi:MAG: CusA/CzcA family heavy metal efflux RND transporter, partial [Puniceicoccales bacterium]|nr:CusA/CzcA family heavy metal efflux RND transporter [Puniceicoccales bacterium]